MEVKLYENDYEKPELTDEFLEHHGIKGQKWGVRNGPPYPLSSGKSKKVRESYGVISKRKKKKQQLKNLEKARIQRAKNIQERKETAKTKEEILKNRDSVAMLKNVDKFTTKEIQDFNTREQAISQLAQNAAKQIENNLPKSQKLLRWVKNTVKEGAKQAIQDALKNVGKVAVKKLVDAANFKENEDKRKQQEKDSKEQAEQKQKTKLQKQQDSLERQRLELQKRQTKLSEEELKFKKQQQEQERKNEGSIRDKRKKK